MVRPAEPLPLPLRRSATVMLSFLVALVERGIGDRRRARLGHLGVVALDGLVRRRILDEPTARRGVTAALFLPRHQISPAPFSTIQATTATMNRRHSRKTAQVTGPGGSA